jgi:hypothetical protein
MKQKFLFLFTFLFSPFAVIASEANLEIPDLHAGSYHIFGGTITA